MSKVKLPFKIKPTLVTNKFQPWIQRIMLIDDTALKFTQDITFGLYYCDRCKIYKPYKYKIPPEPVMFCPVHLPDKKAALACDDPAHDDHKYPYSETGGVSKEAHNEWVDWQLEHAHGDGRVALFERKIEQKAEGESDG